MAELDPRPLRGRDLGTGRAQGARDHRVQGGVRAAPVDGESTASRSAAERASRQQARTRARTGPKRLFTMLEAGQYLAVSYWTVRSWIEAGRLPACRLPGEGKLVRVDVRDLDALIEQCRDPGPEAGRKDA